MDEFKFNDGRLTGFWVGVAGLSVIGGFVAGWLWRDRIEALGNVSLLAALTAMGTVGATCAAVWLGSREGRWRRDDHERRGAVQAILLSGAVNSVLGYLNDLVEHTRGGLERPHQIQGDVHEWCCYRRKLIRRRMTEVSDLREEIPLHEVAGMDLRTSRKIACGVSEARVLLALIDTQSDKFARSPVAETQKMLRKYMVDADNVRANLLAAQGPLNIAAKLRSA